LRVASFRTHPVTRNPQLVTRNKQYMKFRIIYTLMSALALGFLLMSNSGGRAMAQNQGNTGAPGDQEQSPGVAWVCQTCHNGPIQATMMVEVFEAGTMVAVTDYVPAVTYDVKVTVDDVNDDADGYGFQIVSLIDDDESDVNGWSNPGTGVQIATASNTGRSYAEHQGAQDSNEFMVQWTAPAAGTGSVTFYSAGTAVNRNNASDGDGGATTSLTLTERPVGIFSVSALDATVNVFPNPAVNYLNVSVESNFSGTVSADIMDVQGRVAISRPLDLMTGTNATQFDVSQLNTGTYMLRLSSEDKVLTTQFLMVND